MNKFNITQRIQSVVENQGKKVPITNVLKDAFMGVGAFFGGIYGFSNSLHHENGLFWRPSLGMATGGLLGYTVGLFPFHTMGLAIAGDLSYTGYTYYTKKIKPVDS